MIGCNNGHVLSPVPSQSPGSFSSFWRMNHTRMTPTLPFVRESPEFTILSSSDDDDDTILWNPDMWNPDIVKFEDSDDDLVVYPNPIFNRQQRKSEHCVMPNDDNDDHVPLSVKTEPGTARSPTSSALSDSFIVSETPSQTLGSNSSRLSDVPPFKAGLSSDFTTIA
jgi:hypothetical protein